MKKILALAILGGCTQMTDYYPEAQTVEIDGRVFFVAPRPANGPGVYLAGPNKPSGGEAILGAGMSLPIANVAAIEAVTGCPVARETIRNVNTGITFAAVTC